MPDEDKIEIDLDYVILTALLAGGFAAIGTAATLLVKPTLIELGRQLPLPTITELSELLSPQQQK